MKTDDLGTMAFLDELELPLNIYALSWYGEWVQGLFRKGMQDLASMAPPPLQASPSKFGFGEPGLYGPDTEHHAFRHRNYLRGFSLHEPQVTRVLQHLLDPKTAGRDVGVNRCRTFLKALFEASGASWEMLKKFDLDGELHCLKVEAEVLCKTGQDRGNLDLLISWRAEDSLPRNVAIENKLGHHVTAGQLPRYKNKVLEDVRKNKEHAAFFVVAPEFTGKNAKAMRQNANYWKPVTWQGLLRHWELELALNKQQSCEDQDVDFPRLRHAIWTLGVGVD